MTRLLIGLAAALGLGLLLLFNLWQGALSERDDARARAADLQTLYDTQRQNTLAWQEAAEKRTQDALAAARREGAAAASETERQRQLANAYRQIRELQNAEPVLPPECGAVVVRDSDLNRVYRDALEAIANSTGPDAGRAAALPSHPVRLDGPAARP